MLVDPFSSERETSGQAGEIRVFLRLLTPDKQPKLHALLASSPGRPPVSLDDPNVFNILRLIATYPFELLLTSVRILWQAQKLHYGKGLLVYPRPEPIHVSSAGEWNPPEPEKSLSAKVGHAIGWQMQSESEGLAKKVILDWAQRRCDTTGMELRISFLDGVRGPAPVVVTPRDGKSSGMVNVRTADPKFFSNLLCAPSARHYIILASELSTSLLDPDAFYKFFATPVDDEARQGSIKRLAAVVRGAYFRFFLSHSLIPPSPDLVFPCHHWLTGLSYWERLQVLWVLWVTYLADWLEEMVFYLVNARFVSGREPWKIWERALRRTYKTGLDVHGEDESDSDSTGSWEDIGSVLYK